MEILIIILGIIQIFLIFKFLEIANNIREINKTLGASGNCDTIIETCIEGNLERAAEMIIKTAALRLSATTKINLINRDAHTKMISEILAWTRDSLAAIGCIDSLPAHMRSVDAFVAFYDRVGRITPLRK